MKIGIIGHVDHGKSCMTSAALRLLEKHGAEIIQLDEKECFDRGITLSHVVKDEALSITNEMRCNIFTPPMSRAERRKIQRKNGQKRK